MIDEPTLEQLSRYLDGDLDDAATRSLERRIETDAELAAELDSLGNLRRAVGGLSSRMDPPEDLDVMLEPLRVGTPHGRKPLHPALRWIGMAAGLALAATVVIEVVRHDRDPREVVTAPRAEEKQESSEIFQLSPLPTATADEEDIPVGAADRLLARPPAEPRLDEPEPLDVRGPLSTDEISAQKEKGRAQAPRSAAAPTAESFSATDAAERDKARAAEAAPAHASAAPAGEKTAAGKQAGRHAVVRVALVAKDGTAVAEVDLPGPPPPAGTVVTIAAGVIVAESPADLGRDQSDGAIRWLGLAVAGVPDGQYRIEPPAQREVRPVQ